MKWGDQKQKGGFYYTGGAFLVGDTSSIDDRRCDKEAYSFGVLIGFTVDGLKVVAQDRMQVWGEEEGVYEYILLLWFYLRPYRDEPSASRPIRADKHRRGQRVLTWVTSREHCAAAGFFYFFGVFNTEYEEEDLVGRKCYLLKLMVWSEREKLFLFPYIDGEGWLQFFGVPMGVSFRAGGRVKSAKWVIYRFSGSKILKAVGNMSKMPFSAQN